MPASPPAALPRETAAAPNAPHAQSPLPQRCPPSAPLAALTLPAKEEHVPLFRAVACLSLAPHGLQVMKDDVGLVVDELAANAVHVTEHMFSVCMVVGHIADGIVVELHDNSPGLPVLKEQPVLDDFTESGRGLRIVDSLSAQRWGYDKYPKQHGIHPRPSAYIKRVWAVLPFPEAA